MNDKERRFDLDIAHTAVQLDTEGVLGEFLDGKISADRTLGNSTWSSDKSEFFAVRWRFTGRHVGDIPGFGHTVIPPTHNEVSVSGLTLVENTVPGQVVADIDKVLRSNTVVFHRFIDWLAVFAQIGVLHLGRPMPIDDIRFVPPDRGTSRRLGYNDLQEG